MPATAALSYCGRQVRRHDHDRFLTSLFAPPDRREALFAIHAFNIEVAKTREVVTEPILGQIRLQWWRDAIAGLYQGEVLRHEVLEALAGPVERFDLSRAYFDRVIEAREADLTERAPATLEVLERYAEDTAAPLIQLGLEALGVRQGESAAADAAHHAGAAVGTAWALSGLLRAIPFHAQQRRVYLPTAVVEEVAVEMGELFELRPHAGLARAVERIAAAALKHLSAARSRRAQTLRQAVPALLPAVLAENHLGRLRRAGYDVFDSRVQRPTGPATQIRLMLSVALGRF